MSQSLSLGDTPLKRNAAATGVFINGTLAQQREAVMNDLGNIPEVTVNFMLDHIVPNSGINVGRTMQDLRRKGILLDAGWEVFIDALPKDSDGNEQSVFSKMETIYQQIIASTEFDVGHPPLPTLSMGTCPDIAPISETNIRSRPDGCGQLISGHSFHTSQCGYPSQVKGDYHWFNIAYVEEYKKKNTIRDLNDNVLKILWSLHHMMNIDRRRRFAFGVTIENTDTRIWFCCRQMVFVTQPFDFMKDPAKLVRLISSLAYANAAELGYDPTMELFWKNNKWNYWITIKGKDNYGNIITKVYETIDIIVDTSYNLRGRATRVYEACDIESPGTKVVIKDSWVAANRPKEGDTLSEILRDASEEEKAMFLTVLLHGVVTINGRQDLTQDLIMNGYLVSIRDEPTEEPIEEPTEGDQESHDVLPQLAERMADLEIIDHGVQDTRKSDYIHKASIFEITKVSKLDSRLTTSITSSNVSAPDVSSPNSNHQTVQRPRVYGAKAHYRIVFKERGESLHSLSGQRQIKLPLVMQAMRDTLKALTFLTKKGYVHRDISPGNIIVYEGRAKLNDLEFAKVYGAGTSDNVRTGTYNFMAVEVESSRYIYHPEYPDFWHNPLHDLESLWWIGVWFLLCHYKPSNSLDAAVQKHMALVQEVAMSLFNTGTDSQARHRALFSRDILATSQAKRFPKTVQHLALFLDNFRTQLVQYYKTYEPQDRSFFAPDVHLRCDVLFEDILGLLTNDKTELWPWDHIAQRITYLEKRKK